VDIECNKDPSYPDDDKGMESAQVSDNLGKWAKAVVNKQNAEK
jgi:hypothetical protein